MRKKLLIGCLALGLNTFAQTTVFSDDFESGNANWILNTAGPSLGLNQWVVNSDYIGTPMLSIPDVLSQPSSFTGGPNSSYLHINFINDCSGSSPVNCNAHYNAAEVSNRCATMANDITT